MADPVSLEAEEEPWYEIKETLRRLAEDGDSVWEILRDAISARGGSAGVGSLAGESRSSPGRARPARAY